MDNLRFKELDALRGIAALLVILFHFTMLRDEAKLGFKLGTTGVDLFFMISGFVILHSLKHISSSYEFVINRVSRLYPTYWTCVTIVFALIIIQSLFNLNGDKIDVIQYLGNMTMFQFYLRIEDLDAPYWTMIIEMVFYITMLILFYFKLLKYIIHIGLLVLSLMIILFILDFDNIWLIRIIWWIPVLQFLPLFFAGILFYLIATDHKNNFEKYIILVFCLLSQIFLFDYAGRSRAFISQTEYSIMLTIFFILFTLFVNGKLKFIVSRLTLFLGEISFVFYLIHQKISADYLIPFFTNTLNMNFWLALMITLFVIIIISTLITYYIGIPYSKKMKDKLYVVFPQKQ